MKKWITIFFITATVLMLVAFGNDHADNLRKIYSAAPATWPAPKVNEGVRWRELGVVPQSPIEKFKDSLKHVIELGKILFFDTRLSGSGKLSCASCHLPELSWTDGQKRSAGHEGVLTKRNSPSLQDVWFYDKLFWDGRAKDLQDQAFAPINSETEMHNEMPEVMRQLRKISAYRDLFKRAFGRDDINPDRMTEAIAVFEKTTVSNKSRFDQFLEGDSKALSKNELNGLHIFRTKAGCMNCHHGPLFADNQFHRNGFFDSTHFVSDKGRYTVTHNERDIGKFKTPSLRNVALTGPWLHDGSADKLEAILIKYNKGNQVQHDPLLRPAGLKKSEIRDLLSFLNAISAPPIEFIKPQIPQ